MIDLSSNGLLSSNSGSNVIDIHSHVVWGVDDGSPTLKISLQMLRDAADTGTTDIVATPHSNSEFEYVPQIIDERIRQLNEQIGERVKVHRGCDLHLSFDNVVMAIEDPKKFAINGRRYVLVEFSDLHITGSLDQVLDRLLSNDLVPIITHPERNPILQRDTKKINRWMDLGCLVQVTALSVLGGFGKTAHAAAHHLLSQGFVHVIASDAHDPVHRHARLDEAKLAVAAKYGDATADLLFETNPGNILNGRIVADGPIAVEGGKKWWNFW